MFLKGFSAPACAATLFGAFLPPGSTRDDAVPCAQHRDSLLGLRGILHTEPEPCLPRDQAKRKRPQEGISLPRPGQGLRLVNRGLQISSEGWGRQGHTLCGLAPLRALILQSQQLSRRDRAVAASVGAAHNAKTAQSPNQPWKSLRVRAGDLEPTNFS